MSIRSWFSFDGRASLPAWHTDRHACRQANSPEAHSYQITTSITSTAAQHKPIGFHSGTCPAKSIAFANGSPALCELLKAIIRLEKGSQSLWVKRNYFDYWCISISFVTLVGQPHRAPSNKNTKITQTKLTWNWKIEKRRSYERIGGRWRWINAIWGWPSKAYFSINDSSTGCKPMKSMSHFDE